MMSQRSDFDSELLRIEHLTVSFATSGGRRLVAIDDIELTLSRGSILGLVGESGCGKSVTARSILQLVKPPGRIGAASRIWLDGRDLTRLSPDELRRVRGPIAGMIFQEPSTAINPMYTVGNQISETIRAHERVSGRVARTRALELMSLVRIPAPNRRYDDFPHQMSGGMRQRVMIAIAIACHPKLLIADEPTTALDVTIQAQILELLTNLRSQLGMAILIITHDLGIVAGMADRVAIMYAGRIVEQGRTEEVLQDPKHPYTQGLLKSVPVLGMDRGARLPSIPGTVPNLIDLPPGCRFAPRCASAFEKCRIEEPRLIQLSDRGAACWLCELPTRPGTAVLG